MEIRTTTKLMQCKDTSTVIKWFNQIEEKPKQTFFIFDIVNFYPIISVKLLNECITWAKLYAPITELEEKTIMHARKSLLYSATDGKPWTKLNSLDGFDVTMGSYDGAEVCELVGLFILDTLNKQLDTGNICLYRDDGLMLMKNSNGSKADNIRK